MNFIEYVRKIAAPGEAAVKALSAIGQEVTFEKGELILPEGKVCENLYFVKRGCMRGFTNLDGREVTCWFSLDGTLAASFASLITATPSREAIMTIEETTATALPFSSLSKLFQQYHEIETLGRLISQKYYIQLEARTYALQFMSAAERYGFLLENNAELIRRVPLGFLASYIGVSPETLSRIRARP